MEAAAAFGRPRPVVKVEKLAGDGVGDGDSPSKQRDLLVKEDEIESARAEMGEVREENQRLKRSLSQMMKDYEALRTQFIGIVGQDANKLPEKVDDKSNNENQDNDRNQTDETELVSLTLGRFPTVNKNKNAVDEKSSDHNNRNPRSREIINDKDEEGIKESLSLGLNCKFERESTATKEIDSPNRSLANSLDHEAKEAEAGDTSWSPSKGAKTMRSGNNDDVALENPPKRARVSVRARCETATMNDGCQWRKYGQKIAKGNPCPRAYYRCTGSPTCPVRKQVQRCVDDMSILITTYEGTHNHQLPVSATAMASTTSAAAAMLLSGSSSTTPNLKPNFYLPNNSSIIPPISQTNPTITLDLTSNPSSYSSNSAAHFGKFSTSTFSDSRYPFTSHLDFGSSRNNVLTWNNDFLSYNNRNNNPTITANNNIYQSYFQQQRNNHNLNHLNNVASASTSLPHQHQPLPDTIAAATKAISADPSFQSALAAALKSIIGTGSGGGNVTKSLARGDPSLFQLTSTTAPSKGNGCGTSFLSNMAAVMEAGTGTTSNSTTAGNMVFVSGSSLPFSNPKSATASPGDHI